MSLTRRTGAGLLSAALAVAGLALSPLTADAATAYTTASVTLRSGTSTSTTALATVPSGIAINVQCQAKGQVISGTYNTDWWARISYAGRTGYVSRAYVRVPAGTSVPTCGTTTPTVSPTVVGGPVTLRSGTSTSTAALVSIPNGTALKLQCQAKGQAIAGYYNSDWWAKTTYGGRTGYVSRAYVRVPAGVSVPTCSGTVNPPATSVPGGTITREEAISRGRDWVRRGVPYSMYASTWDRNGRYYRTDCSGFVSMAFHLTWSPSTVTLTNYFYPIAKSSLRPGDIIGNLGSGTAGSAGHVVIFNGWVPGTNMTKFYSIEETPPRAVEQVRSWGTSYWNKQGYRYGKIGN